MACPGIDATDEIGDVAVTLLYQKVSSLLRPAAVVAGEDDFRFAVELIVAHSQKVQRNVNGIVELTDIQFIRVAHVDEDEFLAAIHFLLQIVYGDLLNHIVAIYKEDMPKAKNTTAAGEESNPPKRVRTPKKP